MKLKYAISSFTYVGTFIILNLVVLDGTKGVRTLCRIIVWKLMRLPVSATLICRGRNSAASDIFSACCLQALKEIVITQFFYAFAFYVLYSLIVAQARRANAVLSQYAIYAPFAETESMPLCSLPQEAASATKLESLVSGAAVALRQRKLGHMLGFLNERCGCCNCHSRHVPYPGHVGHALACLPRPVSDVLRADNLH